MIDSHTFRDHRLEAAQSTSSPGATSRGWCFSPEPETRAPGFVWTVAAWGTGLTCLFVFTPVIVRALVS